MITADQIPAYNLPSGILFDLTREAAAKRPGVLTKVGMARSSTRTSRAAP